MFEFKANAVYTKSDLEEYLAPSGMDVNHFLNRLRPVKRFKSLYLGRDLIAALESLPAVERDTEEVRFDPLPTRGGGRKPRKRGPGERLIGGVFDRPTWG